MKSCIVMKFGGTSVGSAEAIRAAAQIVVAENSKQPVVVVVSAMATVTNTLVEIAESIRRQDRKKIDTSLSHIRNLHSVAAHHIGVSASTLDDIDTKILELEQYTDSLFAIGEISDRAYDLILSYGEQLSSRMVAAAIAICGSVATAVSATDVIVTTDKFQEARPILESSAQKAKNILRPILERGIIPVVTGFIGATETGAVTTLGRGGSDYSATILGYCLDAREVQIWTDVDGVMTADPRIVPNAIVLPELTYDEAAELSFYGAKVLHPLTMVPAALKNIKITVKNTHNPSSTGTKISGSVNDGDSPARAISMIEPISLITIEGKGMAAVANMSTRFFSSIESGDIQILFFSSALSGHSVSAAVRHRDGKSCVRRLKKEFATEIDSRSLDDIKLEEGQAIVAVVGEKMKHYPGIAGSVFSSLGRVGISIVAIAQGASELSISFIIQQADAHKAVQTVHDELHRVKPLNTGAKADRLSVLHVGVGHVGRELQRQISSSPADIRYCGAFTSRKGVFDNSGLDAADITYRNDSPMDAIAKVDTPFVLADTTASDQTLPLINSVLDRGGYVVLSNKKPLAGSQVVWDELMLSGRVFIETTVGAGLPVIGTIQSLLATGDRIERIEGCFSGSLGYILSQVGEGVTFSEAVMAAKQLGYTEPDPRDDLSGTDVARKALILSRLIGNRLELADIDTHSLFPKSMASLSMDKFMDSLPQLDNRYAVRFQTARKHGLVPRYIATITPTTTTVELADVKSNSDIGELSGVDNIVVIQTRRYHDNPIVIKGPGAGVAVTAAGAIADIIKIKDLCK